MSAAVGIFRGEAPRGRHLEFARLRIAAAEAANYLGDRELSEINRFIADAAQWSKQRGGITTL